MSKKTNDIKFVDLDSLEYEDFEFGKYLRSVRRAKGISIRQLAKEVDKTPTYLSDIENGHNKPPEKELLDTIIQKLNLDEFPKVKDTLFDLAARERNDNVIVVIECKAKTSDHSKYSNLDDYKINGFGSSDDTAKYAIDGALWYASFLADRYDVIAIGVSGQNLTESKLTSFVWPKNGDIFDVMLLADGTLEDSMQSINQYEKDIDIVLERFAATEAEVRRTMDGRSSPFFAFKE